MNHLSRFDIAVIAASPIIGTTPTFWTSCARSSSQPFAANPEVARYHCRLPATAYSRLARFSHHIPRLTIVVSHAAPLVLRSL